MSLGEFVLLFYITLFYHILYALIGLIRLVSNSWHPQKQCGFVYIMRAINLVIFKANCYVIIAVITSALNFNAIKLIFTKVISFDSNRSVFIEVRFYVA